MGFRVIIVFIVSLLILSCKEPPTEVFPLKSLSFVETGTTSYGKSYTIKREYFVVANAPKENSDLKFVIKQYNSHTLTKEEIEKYSVFIRWFYKETDFTPRNYIESNKGYFNHDRIDFHAKDLLLGVKWTNDGMPEEYLFYSKDELP